MVASRYRLVAIVLLITACARSSAQRLTIARIDSSEFPEMRADVYALDENGEAINGLVHDSFTISENGTLREARSLTCPPPHPAESISSVLTIDVSGSMAWSARQGGQAPNIALAKAAAMAWVAGLPAEGSECALTIFDDGSLVSQDFTTDRPKLLDAIMALQPDGGTSYHAGLVAAPAGALEIAKQARHRPVVIFLTDGRGGGSEDAIVAAAERIGATIFCVTLGMPAPPILKNIALRTGGELRIF